MLKIFMMEMEFEPVHNLEGTEQMHNILLLQKHSNDVNRMWTFGYTKSVVLYNDSLVARTFFQNMPCGHLYVFNI